MDTNLITKNGMPRPLRLTLLDEDTDVALAATCDAGRCKISQALIRSYGRGCRPLVDMDFIRLTDRETSLRLFYRTNAPAQAEIITFDRLGSSYQEALAAGEAMQAEAFLSQLHAGPKTLVLAYGVARDRRGHNGTTLTEVRAWAAGAGYDVPLRGPLGKEIIAAYMAEHPSCRKVRDAVEFGEAKGSRNPNMVTRSQPVAAGVAVGRRRAFGTTALTRELVRQGWTPPPVTA